MNYKLFNHGNQDNHVNHSSDFIAFAGFAIADLSA